MFDVKMFHSICGSSASHYFVTSRKQRMKGSGRVVMCLVWSHKISLKWPKGLSEPICGCEWRRMLAFISVPNNLAVRVWWMLLLITIIPEVITLVTVVPVLTGLDETKHILFAALLWPWRTRLQWMELKIGLFGLYNYVYIQESFQCLRRSLITRTEVPVSYCGINGRNLAEWILWILPEMNKTNAFPQVSWDLHQYYYGYMGFHFLGISNCFNFKTENWRGNIA